MFSQLGLNQPLLAMKMMLLLRVLLEEKVEVNKGAGTLEKMVERSESC